MIFSTASFTQNRLAKLSLVLARLLVLLWASAWVYFSMGTFLSGVFSWEGLVVVVVFCSIFIFSAWLGWQRPKIGGAILVLEGVLVFIVYPLLAYARLSNSVIIAMLTTMAAPPLISGFLLALSA